MKPQIYFLNTSLALPICINIVSVINDVEKTTEYRGNEKIFRFFSELLKDIHINIDSWQRKFLEITSVYNLDYNKVLTSLLWYSSGDLKCHQFEKLPQYSRNWRGMRFAHVWEVTRILTVPCCSDLTGSSSPWII